MTAKELLEGYYTAQTNISEMRMKMKELAMKKEAEYDAALGAYRINDMPRAGGNKDLVMQSVERIIGVYNEKMLTLSELIARETAFMMLAVEAVHSAGLTKNEREFVKLRYFENRTMNDASEKMCYSLRTAARFKAAAISKIDTWLAQD